MLLDNRVILEVSVIPRWLERRTICVIVSRDEAAMISSKSDVMQYW